MAVYRFLHLQDLYQVDQDDKVKELVDYMFKEGELPNDEKCKEEMTHRCRKLILSISRWTLNGLLVCNQDNRLVKSSIFQNAWNNQTTIMRNRASLADKTQVEDTADDTIIVEPRNNSPAKVLLYYLHISSSH